MDWFYTLAYWLGLTPWEAAATHPPAARQIAALFDREEEGRGRPLGHALDLGCGRGHWAIVLAQRGWQVTGVEMVTRALHAARERAAAAGAEVTFIKGDVTKLRRLGIRAGFRLVWDFGTVHGLTPAQQLAVGREISAVATQDATVLLVAWAVGQRGPLPRGMGRPEIEQAFEGWRVTNDEPFDKTGLPALLRNVDPRVYRLVRRQTG